MQPETTLVPIGDIVLDPRLQMRETMNFGIIDEYAENLMDLPPGKAVQGPGGVIWLTDGWHTYHAHVKAQQTEMKCIIREGTFLDALEQAAGANNTHGIRRTIADKRRAVLALLMEPLWQDRSDRQIAQACRVSHTFVSQMRAEFEGGNVASQEEIPKKAKEQRERCERCKRLWPDIDQSVGGCQSCFELSGSYRRDKEDDEDGEDERVEEVPEQIFDDAGVTVPVRLVEVFKARQAFRTAAALLTSCSKAFAAIEKGPTKAKKSRKDRHYRKFFPTFRSAREALVALEPSMVCPKCGGDGCGDCQEDGYLSREEVEANGEKS